MKLLQEPIDVSAGEGGAPLALHWRDTVYRVTAVLQQWTWRGRWWTDADLRGERRHYYRVSCEATAQAVPSTSRSGRTSMPSGPSLRRTTQPSGPSLRRTPQPSRRAVPSPPPRLHDASPSAPACFDIFEQDGRWMLCRLLD